MVGLPQLIIAVDDGHKMRVKVLAKEIERGIKSLNALQARAYMCHIAEKPFPPGWVEEPGLDSLDMNKPAAATGTSSWDAAESPTTISQLVAAAGIKEAQTHDTSSASEEEDIIDLKLRRQVPQPWRLPSIYKRFKAKYLHLDMFLPEKRPIYSDASNPCST